MYIHLYIYDNIFKYLWSMTHIQIHIHTFYSLSYSYINVHIHLYLYKCEQVPILGHWRAFVVPFSPRSTDSPPSPPKKDFLRFRSSYPLVLILARRDFLGSGPLILCASWLTDPPHKRGFFRFGPSDPQCKLTYRSTSQEGIS